MPVIEYLATAALYSAIQPGVAMKTKLSSDQTVCACAVWGGSVTPAPGARISKMLIPRNMTADEAACIRAALDRPPTALQFAQLPSFQG